MHKVISLIIIICFLFLVENVHAANDGHNIDPLLNQLFTDRTQLLITNDFNTITTYYDQTIKTSKQAFEHELKRNYYLKTWAKVRGIQFHNIEGKINITNIDVKDNTINIKLTHHIEFAYTHNNQPLLPINTFGIRTRHELTLKNKDGNWIVVQDIYTDPIEDNPGLIPKTLIKTYNKGVVNHSYYKKVFNDQKKVKNSKYNRSKALQYANKYSGASVNPSENQQYNPEYPDFTNRGGDCTNFVSQLLGDPEGGGLPMLNNWFFKEERYSKSWINTDAFKDFLINQGYGQVIAVGSFKDIIKSTKTFPHGALKELRIGDLIGYEIDGDVVHFSVVAREDSNGYLTVNSHTADRYHAPWDLGWGENTKFWLIHIVA